MKSSYMRLLMDWREDVRRNTRDFTAFDGRHYNMSLTSTCQTMPAGRANFATAATTTGSVAHLLELPCRFQTGSGARDDILLNTFLLSGFTFLAVAARGAEGQPITTRWGMAIDTAKCATQQNCTKCIDACHLTQRSQSATSATTCFGSGRSSGTPSGQVDEKIPSPGDGPLQPLRQSALRARLSDAGHLEAGRRYRGDGQTAASAAGIAWRPARRSRSFNFRIRGRIEANPDYPTRNKGVVEKCTLCGAPGSGRVPSCVGRARQSADSATWPSEFADPPVATARQHIRRKPEPGTRRKFSYRVRISMGDNAVLARPRTV
jgi:Fe-S-cluster-containing dehydrogenase component